MSCEGEPWNGWGWVSLPGASSLRAPGFAEQIAEWKRSEFEWFKLGGKPSSTGDVNERPLHFKMMAALRDRILNRGRQKRTRLWRLGCRRVKT